MLMPLLKPKEKRSSNYRHIFTGQISYQGVYFRKLALEKENVSEPLTGNVTLNYFFILLIFSSLIHKMLKISPNSEGCCEYVLT